MQVGASGREETRRLASPLVSVVAEETLLLLPVERQAGVAHQARRGDRGGLGAQEDGLGQAGSEVGV